MGGRTYFEEVGDAGLGEVDVGVGGIFGLEVVRGGGSRWKGEGRRGYHCGVWAVEIGWRGVCRCGRVIVREHKK